MVSRSRLWLVSLVGLMSPLVGHADPQLPVNGVKSFQVTTPGYTNRYMRHADGLGYTEVVNAGSSSLLKADASFKIVPGLANGGCYSFESVNYPGQYLRHSAWRIHKDAPDGSGLFSSDATWCARNGRSGTGVSLESINYPGAFLRHRNGELWLDYPNGGSYDADASWAVVDAWSASGGGCSATDWQYGVIYRLGDVVRYPANGNYYKEVNVGGNGSDATDPTISTWYWQPTSCSSGGGGGGGGGNFVVSEAQFNQMFPSRNGLYTYAGLLNAMTAYPGFAHTGSDTTQKQEGAAFLANIAHESDSLRATREYNTANWPLYCDTSNGNSCAPGQQYYGRGPIQLSWNYNYRAAGQALGIDLWGNPDLVATDSTVAWKTAVWYWMTGTGNAGVTAHDAITGGRGFGTTIRALNGSVECNGARPDQVQSRINFYTNFSAIIGVDPGGNLGC